MKYLLIDGSGLIFRAYYAFIRSPLTTSKGENTSAIFGFFNFIDSIIREFQPENLLVAFDHSRKTFRTEIYPEYKAQRDEVPQDLIRQIKIIRELTEKMNIAVWEKEGFEADDLIGTLTETIRKKNPVHILSGDKDLMQLVDPQVSVIRPAKGMSGWDIYTSTEVRKKLGIDSSQIIDYLAIVGDSSDNIPGIKGIGIKGAVKLLNQYSSLEEIYQHLHEIKGANQKKLIESRENAFLSYRLATIKKDIPLDFPLDNLILRPETMISGEIIEEFKNYELISLIKKFQKNENEGTLFQNSISEPEPVQWKGDYKFIDTAEKLKNLTGAIIEKGVLSIDTETTSPLAAEAEILGISVSLSKGSGYFVPLSYKGGQEFSREEAIKEFKPLLEDSAVRKIGQNLKYEYSVFMNEGIYFKGIDFDTMIAAHLTDPGRNHVKLENLIKDYFHIEKEDYKHVLKRCSAVSLSDIPVKDITDYACSDSDACLYLHERLLPMIAELSLETAFYEYELPLIPVLAEMEMTGIMIDHELLKQYSIELKEEINIRQKKIKELAGRSFNMNSSQQLSVILFENIGLEPVKKTPKGKPSTDEESLRQLAEKHPLPAEILAYRSLTKLKNTYVDRLPELICQKTGRIHTSFHQTVTATGRLSSSDPNLQNIPVRDENGKKIREAFICSPDTEIISADYSQIELRVLAHFCGDENLIGAFKEEKDIHSQTASIIFNVPETEVTPDMRRKAKSVNFGIIYGQQAFGLSKQLEISFYEAKLFIEDYFHHFPKVYQYIESLLGKVSETGEIRTMSGRFRRFPDLKGKKLKNVHHLSNSQRMAVNTQIQGSAADIIKQSMILCRQKFREHEISSTMNLQIHDELLFEIYHNEKDTCLDLIRKTMQNAVSLKVPLTVEIGIGENWRQAH